MKIKFYIKVMDYSSLGAVTSDGGIIISKRTFRRIDVFLSVLLHELAHWFFDCFNFNVLSLVHYWLDIVYARIGLYSHSINRRLTIERVKEEYGRNNVE